MGTSGGKRVIRKGVLPDNVKAAMAFTGNDDW